VSAFQRSERGVNYGSFWRASDIRISPWLIGLISRDSLESIMTGNSRQLIGLRRGTEGHIAENGNHIVQVPPLREV